MPISSFTAGQRVTAAALNALMDVYARKTANQTVSSSTVLVDDTELQISLAANSTYTFEAYIDFSTSTAGDFKFGFAYTGSALSADWAPYAPSGGLTTDVGSLRVPAAAGMGASRTIDVGTTAQLAAIPRGSIVTNTAGILKLQWAQSTSDAGVTTVFANSWIRARMVL